jgi:hypothetical protein
VDGPTGLRGQPGLPHLGKRGHWVAVDVDEFDDVVTARGDVPDGGKVSYEWVNDACLVYNLHADACDEPLPGGDLPLTAELVTADGSRYYRIEPAAAAIATMRSERHVGGGPCLDAAAKFAGGLFVCAAHDAAGAATPASADASRDSSCGVTG